MSGLRWQYAQLLWKLFGLSWVDWERPTLTRDVLAGMVAQADQYMRQQEATRDG